MSPLRTVEPEIAPVVWHDLECGSYRADLGLWRDLATRTAGPDGSSRVLDLGCGTGRVTLDLAAAGHRVTGLDLDRRLTAELRRRAGTRNVSAGAVVGDARRFDLRRRFDMVLAAMQFLQLLPTPAERIAAMTCARAHLRKGGLLPAALFDLEGESIGDEYIPPLPDMHESHGWVWSSQATAIRLHDDGAALTLERLRRAVSPRGEIAETEDRVRLQVIRPGQLEDEMRAAGIQPIERWVIRPTEEHVGSDVVIGEVRDG
jgi:SAM-dependent methyltransferase